ncbi:hypothetical protein ACWCPJ_36590 [Streptomyces collinus]
MTAVAAVAAAAVGAVALPASAADHHPGRMHAAVYISGVRYDSPGRDDRSNWSLNKEWVDITNSTRRGAVNLDGWTLRDDPRHRRSRGVSGREAEQRSGQDGRDSGGEQRGRSHAQAP